MGFQQPEAWGVWSAEDPARITLQREVSGRVRLILVSKGFGNQAQALQVQMGDMTKTVQLGAEPTTFQLEYDLRRRSRLLSSGE